ncbi:MAG: DegT/DnrJ/EryC1/StrS family aminotransferase [Bacteroidales bacterium]|jgi:dTDP-4-amino-4,6-dideoxygalactose transaminase|nr:DegT/DnrJ/EryC1/StrS family aminotransferase [Bacteroidales bacterium]MDD2688205.1 DegT/DnrJ/EryC1/StrS family aminotransferase [Bacteroidales bacterium]MDD3330354.1 DegT/DnrJ/EryC1/StrS family aminotransferase [Bacteroidales bacterium]MDD3690760.1 DegT/DnrJ/EryC1/StrS family aminotransferase [Bacteroidales bacterium]MDD4044295.1 DegT/DnrJ/EryC1/StrS family aminotransferase [Bacteroidales bacterium]
MRKIQMVDLQNQYQEIKEEINQSIQDILTECTFINGPSVKQFQSNLEKYLDVKHVIPCGNGTDALQVALMALDLKPGDEVITTTFTFIATAEVIALLQLTPVLVDVDADTFNIDIEAVKKAITSKTKAIIPVHLFGQCAHMEDLLKIADSHHLYVIEDACQAIGADYCFSNGTRKKAGTIGTIGCTSFFPSKNLGCYGDGGAIFTQSDNLAKKMRGIVNHGMFVRYYHDLVGVNSRLDSLQAAILDIKLKHLDAYIQKRNHAAAFYNQAFANHLNLKTPVIADYTNHVFHQYTLVLQGVDRDKVITYMQDKGIPVMIYYPVPLHLQKAYQDPRYVSGVFPVSESLASQVISLPMHTELDNEQLHYITSHLLKAVEIAKQ